MQDKPKRKPGRPRECFLNEDQLVEMDKMAFIQCKHRTIAEALDVDKETLLHNYKARLHKKSALGRVALRRTQWEMARKNATMATFLGKNVLGQSDKQQMELTGKDGGALALNVTVTKTYADIDQDASNRKSKGNTTSEVARA